MNRGDSDVLRSRLSGSRPIAAPTSMRSVRTNPGHTDTTDTPVAPCRGELVRGVGGDAVERALPHAVRDLPRVLLGARRAHVHDEPAFAATIVRAANTLAT